MFLCLVAEGMGRWKEKMNIQNRFNKLVFKYTNYGFFTQTHTKRTKKMIETNEKETPIEVK